MRIRARFALPLALVGLIASFPLLAKHSSKAEDQAAVYFVLKTQNATIAKKDKGYVLTLQGVQDKILWFSSGPVRKSGFIPASLFISRWEKLGSQFSRVPPNAVMTYCCQPGDAHCITTPIAIVLSNPRRIKEHEWTFTVTTLNGNLMNGEYNKVSIFLALLKEYSSTRHVPTVDLTGY